MQLLDWMTTADSEHGVSLLDADSDTGWRFVSYHSLAEKIRGATDVAREEIVRRGVDAPVFILAAQPLQFLVAFYATLAAGGIPCPLATPLTFTSPDAHRDHISSLAERIRPGLSIVDDEHRAVLEAALGGHHGPVIVAKEHERRRTASEDAPPAPHRLDEESAIGLLQFTSGSSGTPKGVRVSMANLWEMTRANIAMLAGPREQVAVTWLPHYHDMGLIGMLLTPITAGHSIRLMTPAQFLRAPQTWLEAMGAPGPPTYTASPSFGYGYAARKLQAHQFSADLDLARCGVAIVAAERSDPRALQRFLSFAQPLGFRPTTFASANGLAEATLTTTATRRHQPIRFVAIDTRRTEIDGPVQIISERLLDSYLRAEDETVWVASCGSSAPGTDVSIRSESGVRLPDDHIGEIHVAGPTVARGYHSSSSDQLATCITPGGRLSTGDIGFIHDGELYVLGRAGDSVKLRGKALFAEDVEAAIRSHSGTPSGKVTVVLGSPAGIPAVAVLVESTTDPVLVRAIVDAIDVTVPEPLPLTVLEVPTGTILRTSSGKPRRKIMWQKLRSDEPFPSKTVFSRA